MPAIGILFLLFALVTSLVLPWINRSNIGELRDMIQRLQAEVNRLTKEGIKADIDELRDTVRWLQAELHQTKDSATAVKDPVAAPIFSPPKKESHETAIPIPPIFPETVKADEFAAELAVPGLHGAATGVPSEEEGTFERQFGGRAFVWLGGIALALAGFFMVKYSIETGLLSPTVRTVLGVIFGVALLGGGDWVRRQPHVSNGIRIAQALSGAGIADLYASIFAATSLYHLVPSLIGFTGLAGVTATAVVLSLRHGMPIALLGLVGGFLTPALVGSANPSAPLLFLYLYFPRLWS